jgi:MFS family permease
MILGGIGALLGLSLFLTPFKVISGQDKIEVDTLKKGHASKLFIVFCIGFIFSGLMYRSFTVVLPSYLEFQLGNITSGFKTFIDNNFGDLTSNPAFNTLTANLIATGIYIIGIVGQLLGGRVADTFSLKWAYLTFFCIAAPFLVGMALFTNSLLIVFAGIFVLFSLGMQPIENSLVAYLTPPQWRSVSYGIKFTLAFGVGSFAVKIVSWTESLIGIENIVWLIFFFLSMVIVVISIFLILSRGTKIDHKLTT